MGHANTSETFQELFGMYPCGFPGDFCDVVQGECPHRHNIGMCPEGLTIRKQTTKICDSGIFTKRGCLVDDYQTLFDIYEKMGADYGVIIDHLQDSHRTIESAATGIKIHRERTRLFRLIGVAQGETLQEYVACYEALKSLGFEHIAVGGLLKKRENTARYVNVRDEKLLDDVLTTIRNRHPCDWLYALGCYHPKRHSKFRRLRLFGGDYKGWIFNYVKLEEGDRDSAQRHRFAEVRRFLRQVMYSQLLEDQRTKKLLIIPCSKLKDPHPGLMPAVKRYAGPFYRLINGMGRPDNLDILILSAKYGLISAETPIEYYDMRMSDARAAELQPSVTSQLKERFAEHAYDEVFINLGKQYEKALDGIETYMPNTTQMTIAEGRIGQRLKQMKEWLLSDAA